MFSGMAVPCYPADALKPIASCWKVATEGNDSGRCITMRRTETITRAPSFKKRSLSVQTCDRAPSITRDINGRWSVDLPSCYSTFELTHKWAGKGVSGHKLLEYGLNLQEPTLYENNADREPVIDMVRTIATRAGLREIKDAFSEWVKDDKQADIHPQIERIHNETFNATHLIVVQNGITRPNWLDNTDGADDKECD